MKIVLYSTSRRNPHTAMVGSVFQSPVAALRVCACVWLLLACSSAISQTPTTMEADDWVYEDQAISVRIEASAGLNTVSARAHSLVIGIFQLSDPTTFSGFSVTRSGAVELLDKGRADDSIISVSKIIVKPGERKKVALARSYGVKYIGLIVGYFQLNPQQDVKLFHIPVVAAEHYVTGEKPAIGKTLPSAFKGRAGHLNLSVILGSTNTQQMQRLDDPPAAIVDGIGRLSDKDNLMFKTLVQMIQREKDKDLRGALARFLADNKDIHPHRRESLEGLLGNRNGDQIRDYITNKMRFK